MILYGSIRSSFIFRGGWKLFWILLIPLSRLWNMELQEKRLKNYPNEQASSNTCKSRKMFKV